MSKAKKTIGFDRRIQLDWLDLTAEWAAQGRSAQEIRDLLDRVLEGKVAGNGARSAREKTKTVLLHVWVVIPDKLHPLREAGLALLQSQHRSARLALHWGMCMAAYPFFGEVVGEIGRLSLLQGKVTLQQVRRRIVERWGDTERVHRSVRHVTQTLRDWAVLDTGQQKGTYIPKTATSFENRELQVWLVEANILASGTSMCPLRQLVSHPALFPFTLTLTPQDISRNPRLEIFRQGLDEDIVMLRSS